MADLMQAASWETYDKTHDRQGTAWNQEQVERRTAALARSTERVVVDEDGAFSVPRFRPVP